MVPNILSTHPLHIGAYVKIFFHVTPYVLENSATSAASKQIELTNTTCIGDLKPWMFFSWIRIMTNSAVVEAVKVAICRSVRCSTHIRRNLLSEIVTNSGQAKSMKLTSNKLATQRRSVVQCFGIEDGFWQPAQNLTQSRIFFRVFGNQ